MIKHCSIVGIIKTWGKQTKALLSHLDSRVFIGDFTRSCFKLWETKKLSRNTGQFKCVTTETRYYVSIAELLIQNLYSWVAELVQSPSTMLKILCCSGATTFSKYYQGKSLFITGQENLIIYWHRRYNLRPGRQCQPGRILPGQLDRMYVCSTLSTSSLIERVLVSFL